MSTLDNADHTANEILLRINKLQNRAFEGLPSALIASEFLEEIRNLRASMEAHNASK